MDILSGYIQAMAQKPKMEQDMISPAPEESEVVIDEDI